MIRNSFYSWRSPSNIALVKYWGKRPSELQMPQNPSLSFSLKRSYTETSLEYQLPSKGMQGPQLEFLFDGKRAPSFERRIQDFLQLLMAQERNFSFLNEGRLLLASSNSFPHSAGLASSASSMSALALCLCSLEREVRRLDQDGSEELFLRRASHIARMASGSASRSIYGGWVLWGSQESLTGSSDQYAVPFANIPSHRPIHKMFTSLQNSILVVDREPKGVSSRAGHSLMDNHPFAPARYETARTHLTHLSKALMAGDFELFTELVENEAMTLHALMMSSTPSFCLLRPRTLQVLDKIKNRRQTNALPMAFTMDAGPNVHLLYPLEAKEKVEAFIGEELLPLCQDGMWIKDEIGTGPVFLGMGSKTAALGEEEMESGGMSW